MKARVFSVLLVFFPASSALGQASTPTIKSIWFMENAAFTDAELTKELPADFRPGRPFTEEGSAAARETIVTFYRNRGYADAAASTSTARSGEEVKWTLSIQEGPLYRFSGKVSVLGLQKLPEAVVRRELKFKEGDPYSPPRLFETQSRLYRTGHFDDVRIVTSTSPRSNAAAPYRADVEIRVAERPMKWLKAGVGWGSEERQRLSLVLTHNNLWRTARKLELSSSVSAIWLEHAAEYVDSYFLGTRTLQSARASWRREDRQGYDTELVQGIVGLERELWRRVFVSAHYRLQRTSVFNTDPEIALITPGESMTASIETALKRDTANDLFYPTGGTRAGLTLERSGGFVGGQIHFLKAEADASLYRRVWKSLIFAATGRSGAARPTSPSTEIPIFERFFAGGANSVRGYSERGVGPTDIQGSPVGGNLRLGSSLELRFPLVWRLTGAAFVDGGQVGQKIGFVLPSEWKYGAGGGVRLQTPVGPLRADLGYKVNPERGERQWWRLHFSLGEAF